MSLSHFITRLAHAICTLLPLSKCVLSLSLSQFLLSKHTLIYGGASQTCQLTFYKHNNSFDSLSTWADTFCQRINHISAPKITLIIKTPLTLRNLTINSSNLYFPYTTKNIKVIFHLLDG